MTWPTGPPPMPAPGWYDDPELPWTWRYWDGTRWSEHRAPMWVPPHRDPTSFSVWFERTVAGGKTAVRRVGVLLVVLWLLLGTASWFLITGAFDGDQGRELRRLLLLDDPLSPTGSALREDLSDAQAERAWELVRDIFWSALPWLIVLTVAFVVVSAWSVALVARAVQPNVVDPLGGDAAQEGLGSLAAGALRRAPAVIASGIVVFVVYSLVWAAASIPIVLVAVADGGGAAIVLTTFFVVLLVLGVTVLLWGRLTLASVLAAVGGHGVGVRRSWGITRGRFWFVVGRLLVAGLIAGAAGGVVNLVTGFGQLLGVAVFVASMVVLLSLAVAASTIVTTCGHLATIEQLGEAELAGSSQGHGAA